MENSELNDIMLTLRKFAQDRDWQQFHSPKNLSMALCVEAAELLEHFQWLPEQATYKLAGAKQQSVSHELADIFIYLIRLCDQLDVDLLRAARQKIRINNERYPVDKVKGSPKKYSEY